MNKIKFLVLLILTAGVPSLAMAGEITQITAATRHLVPKGKALDAIDGDWIMRNDQVVLVIGNAVAGREANMRVQNIQGAIIDFTSIKDNNDYLVVYYPHAFPADDVRSNPVIFADKINVLKRKGTEIVLQAVRNATDKTPYLTVTTYTLRDGEDFVRINTTFSNNSKQEVLLSITDKIKLDQDITDASPVGYGNLAFIYNKWFNAAYGIYSPTGLYIRQKPITGHNPDVGFPVLTLKNLQSTDTAAMVGLKAGQKIELTRYLYYGKDVAEIQRSIAKRNADKTKLTAFRVADIKKVPVGKVFLEVFNKENELVSFAITNTAGGAEIPLKAGEYKFRAAKIGHDTVTADFSVDNKAGIIPVTMQALTSIVFHITEGNKKTMLPLQVEFKGLDGTPDPYLGITKRAEGTNNFYYAAGKNDFSVPISPGHYLAVISHGPEYETVYKEIEIRRGESGEISASMNRMFVTPDWVISDFHNHTTRSGDNDGETRSRILSIAGAGIEFAPATEHNRISSFSNEIKELGLQEYIASAAGIELTGPPGKSPNHENAFPLRIQEGKQGNGYPGIDPDPYVQLKSLYDYDNGKFKYIQHNHPSIPMLYFDKNMDGVIDDGYGTRKFTQAIELQDFEILNATSDEATDKNRKNRSFYWLQMLNQGDRIYGTVTSDYHMVGPGSRGRFVYVYTKKDKPASIDANDIALSAKSGHIIMSNGPFIKTDINGYLPGDEVKGSNLKMNIEVYANNEIEIDRIQLLFSGRQQKELNFTRANHPEMFSKNALQFKYSFPLVLNKDENVIVVATGSRKFPDVKITDKGRIQVPTAVSDPFFVDVNSDGFEPNKDTLGVPLPVGKKNAK